jgi:hypothetical protein
MVPTRVPSKLVKSMDHVITLLPAYHYLNLAGHQSSQQQSFPYQVQERHQ